MFFCFQTSFVRIGRVFCFECRRAKVILFTYVCSFLSSPTPLLLQANWVTGQQLQNAFICAQGPLPHTCRDFWTMVWQERVHHIFMLCRVTELNRPKCAQYWPSTRGETMCFGTLLVRNDGVQLSRCGNIVATALNVSMGPESRRIFHHQWATWPDRFIPRHVEPAMRLLDCSRSCPCNPTVVHCSAGLFPSFFSHSSFH